MDVVYTLECGTTEKKYALDSTDPKTSKKSIKEIMNFLNNKLTGAKILKASLKYGYKQLLRTEQHQNSEDKVKKIGTYIFDSKSLTSCYSNVSIRNKKNIINITRPQKATKNNEQGSETSQ